VQLVTVGLLAEMQARTYHESQGKPVYVIRRVLDTPAALRDDNSPPRPRALTGSDGPAYPVT
jgi:hypothetical protein